MTEIVGGQKGLLCVSVQLVLMAVLMECILDCYKTVKNNSTFLFLNPLPLATIQARKYKR